MLLGNNLVNDAEHLGETRVLVMKRSSLSEELQSEGVRTVCELPYPLVL